MQRRYVNLLVDAVGLLLFFGLVSTGTIMAFILPPRMGGGGRATLMGLDRHGWGDIHFWISVGFLAMVVLHLFLHWRWLWGIVGGGTGGANRGRRGLAILSGVVVLFAVMVGGPFLLEPGVDESAGGGRGQHGARRQAGRSHEAAGDSQTTSGAQSRSGESSEGIRVRGQVVNIRGSMTLNEVSSQTGISVERLRGALKLPSDASADERLGRLRQQYGFEMSGLRAAVQRLVDEAPR